MLVKLYLDDGIADIAAMVQQCEAIEGVECAVYDEKKHLIAIECAGDIRSEIQKLDILGFEVEQ